MCEFNKVCAPGCTGTTAPSSVPTGDAFRRTWATPGELRSLIRATMGKDAAARYAGASIGDRGKLK